MTRGALDGRTKTMGKLKDPTGPKTGEQDPTATVLSLKKSEIFDHYRAGAGRVPVLQVLVGQEIGRRYLLNAAKLHLGRSGANVDLAITGDAEISGRHAILVHDDEGFTLTDLGSLNGSYVDGEAIEGPTRLNDGAKILLGATVLRFGYQDDLEEDFNVAVERMMNVDDLTGLPVKRVFDRRLRWALLSATREEQPLTVLMMDMDRLKAINDRHGHPVGAATIAAVGRLLGEIVGTRGMVTRFGGDEYTAYLKRCPRSAGLEIAETIRAAVAEPFVAEGVEVNPTMSTGISSYPEDGEDQAGLIRAADAALYRAKAAGKNIVCE